jgi:hypothetical protein
MALSSMKKSLTRDSQLLFAEFDGIGHGLLKQEAFHDDHQQR